MSAFLGPIHKIVYAKCMRLDRLTAEIIDEASKEYNMDYANILNEALPSLTYGNLEEIIDLSNIHGWLSEQVELAELRYAYIVGAVSKQDKGIDLLKRLSFRAGEEISDEISKQMSVKQAFNTIGFNVLDGMPCDGGINVVLFEDDAVEWSLNLEAHKMAWGAVNSSIDDFIKLRHSLYDGIFSKIDYKLTYVSETSYRMEK